MNGIKVVFFVRFETELKMRSLLALVLILIGSTARLGSSGTIEITGVNNGFFFVANWGGIVEVVGIDGIGATIAGGVIVNPGRC